MQAMKDLIRNNSFCVLATCFEDKPHCSLMSYATDSDCRELFMITQSDTRKFWNLSRNPTVSVLIDSRSTKLENPQAIQALTLGGKIYQVTDPEQKERARQLLREAHPELNDLTLNADVMLLRMQIETSQLFEGLKKKDLEI